MVTEDPLDLPTGAARVCPVMRESARVEPPSMGDRWDAAEPAVADARATGGRLGSLSRRLRQACGGCDGVQRSTANRGPAAEGAGRESCGRDARSSNLGEGRKWREVPDDPALLAPLRCAGFAPKEWGGPVLPVRHDRIRQSVNGRWPGRGSSVQSVGAHAPPDIRKDRLSRRCPAGLHPAHLRPRLSGNDRPLYRNRPSRDGRRTRTFRASYGHPRSGLETMPARNSAKKGHFPEGVGEATSAPGSAMSGPV